MELGYRIKKIHFDEIPKDLYYRLCGVCWIKVIHTVADQTSESRRNRISIINI